MNREDDHRAGAPAPDIDALWDFAAPAKSEAAFRNILSNAAVAGDAWRLELMTQIARAQGLQRRFDEAIATLDEIERELREEAIRPRIRHLLERGRVLNSSGSPREARPFFEQAWRLAGAHGEDALAIDAAHMVAIVAEDHESLRWNREALEVAEASTDPKARRWAASLHNNMGWTHHGRGDLVAAMLAFRRALDHRVQHGSPRQIHVAKWCVARTLRSMGRIEEALEAQRALQGACAGTSSPDGFVEEELAECLLELGRPGEARPHFAAAFAQLSRDPWLAEREPDRIRRLGELASRHPNAPSD